MFDVPLNSDSSIGNAPRQIDEYFSPGVQNAVDDFFDSMSSFSQLFDCQFRDLRRSIAPAMAAYLNITFAEKEDLPVEWVREILDSHSLAIPGPRLTVLLASLAFEGADYVPRKALTEALERVIDGDAFEGNDVFWKGLKYARRAFKVAVNMWRMFDTSHSGGELAIASRAIGKINDIARHGARPQVAVDYGAEALINFRALGTLPFECMIVPDSAENVKRYLSGHVDRIGSVGRDESQSIPVEAVHECRKSLQSFINIFRFMSIEDGAADMRSCTECRALTILSHHLGELHEPFVPLQVMNPLAYSAVAIEVPQDLKEALKTAAGKMERSLGC